MVFKVAHPCEEYVCFTRSFNPVRIFHFLKPCYKKGNHFDLIAFMKYIYALI